jgi:hypothetical protein
MKIIIKTLQLILMNSIIIATTNKIKPKAVISRGATLTTKNIPKPIYQIVI